MIFSPESIAAILDGIKTVTRRLHKGTSCYYKEGCEYPVCPGRGQKAIAHIRITEVLYESMPGASVRGGRVLDWNEEGRREGFTTWECFRMAYGEINGRLALGAPCWRIEFERVEEAPSGSQD